MARPRVSALKRQREQAKRERQQRKVERRGERKHQEDDPTSSPALDESPSPVS